MADDKELRDQVQRIAGLVREVDEIADPAARTLAKQLVQLLVELHGAALERMLDKVFQSGETGVRVIDELGADPLVGGLLAFYGLHPQSLETRVEGAVEKLAAKLESQEIKLEIASLFEGDIQLRVTLGGHTCGSTAATVKTEVEDAIYSAAPDLSSLSISGLEGRPANGFVALDKLVASPAIPTNSNSDSSTAEALSFSND